MLKRWDGFARFLDDGRICLGRKSWLFAGSDRGGERAAVMYTLIGTATLNDVDPQTWSLASPRCRRFDCMNSCPDTGRLIASRPWPHSLQPPLEPYAATAVTAVPNFGRAAKGPCDLRGRFARQQPPLSLSVKRYTIHDVALNSLCPLGHEILEGLGERSNEVVRIQ